MQSRLKEIIESRRKKKVKKATAKPAKEEPERGANVVSIMDALKKSLEAEKKGKR